MVDKNNRNPLEELFTNSGQLDQEALLAVLRPYIRLHKDSGTVIYTQTGIGLSAAKKIILLFLAKKALYTLGVIPSEDLTPKEVKVEFSSKHIPSGTIDATLKRFSDNGPLVTRDGKYFIPDFNFYRVQEMFNRPNNE